MYSWARASVNARKAVKAPVAAVAMIAWLVMARHVELASGQSTPAFLHCDDALAALFTPLRPQLGRYEVCTTPAAIATLAPPEWQLEAMTPLDAFGAAGPYDRPALSRLYGGRRVVIARGWTQSGNRFESVTLISPHPDAMLTHLLPGTLIIRHVIIR